VCRRLADVNDSWALAADVAWGITAALALTEIVLLILPGERAEPSTGQFSFAIAPVPLPDGAMITARLALGSAP
jgi:hypothetical protein